MKLVLLSGGSGTRLWPMSNDSRSKQFLKVFPGVQMHSMVQRVWQQLTDAGFTEDTYICASKAQKDMIVSQLGDVPVIEEPFRRDTFAAISLATAYLRDCQGAALDEVVVVLPVDPYVDQTYFEKLRDLERLLHETSSEMVLMGVQPTEPSSKFGYIQVEKNTGSQSMSSEVFSVRSFVEKPNTSQAKALLSDGALWNCGVFCFRVDYLLSVLEAAGLPTSYGTIRDNFEAFPKRSFDYEVVEKAKEIRVTPYTGAWQDIGTWNTFSEYITESFIGLGQAVNCEETQVVNELGIPLVAVGLKQTVVVATPDGILVSDKAHTENLKTIVSEFIQRPMYEERRWGTYRVLDYQTVNDGSIVLTKCIELHAGKNLSYQRHFHRSEVWTIFQGQGRVAMDGQVRRIGPGDVITVQPVQWHALCAENETLKLIEVQRGSVLVEEDIERMYLDWQEIQNHCLR
jgi:mannose-1-phosphate guanylyltransferase